MVTGIDPFDEGTKGTLETPIWVLLHLAGQFTVAREAPAGLVTIRAEAWATRRAKPREQFFLQVVLKLFTHAIITDLCPAAITEDLERSERLLARPDVTKPAEPERILFRVTIIHAAEELDDGPEVGLKTLVLLGDEGLPVKHM